MPSDALECVPGHGQIKPYRGDTKQAMLPMSAVLPMGTLVEDRTDRGILGVVVESPAVDPQVYTWLLGLSRLGLSRRLLRLVNDVGSNFKALCGRMRGDIACGLENLCQAPLEIAAEYLLGTLHDFPRLRDRLVRDIAGLFVNSTLFVANGDSFRHWRHIHATPGRGVTGTCRLGCTAFAALGAK